MGALFQDRLADWPSVVMYDSRLGLRQEVWSVSEIRRSRSKSRDYRLFKGHRVTKQADIEDFALCVIVTVIFRVL
jgi:hypothetical protein